MLKFIMLAYVASVGVPEDPFPSISEPPVAETGIASWYGDGNWHGEITASGERFRPYEEVTCAHRTLPFDTVVLVEAPSTGKKVWCRVNDRGPYMTVQDEGPRQFNPPGVPLDEGEQWHGILDMSALGAKKLDAYEAGLFEVRLRYWVPAKRNIALSFRP